MVGILFMDLMESVMVFECLFNSVSVMDFIDEVDVVL